MSAKPFSDRTYKADGRIVIVNPKTETGTTISMGFPLLTVNDWVNEPEKIAQLIADLLNAQSTVQS